MKTKEVLRMVYTNGVVERLISSGTITFLVILTVLLLLSIAHGEEVKNFDLSIKGTYTIYRDSDLRENGTGIKAEFKWKYIYLWGSYEQTEMRLTGQVAGDVALFGVGLGGKVNIVKPVSVFIEIGYYIPNSDLAANTQYMAEGVYYKWYRLLNEIGLRDYAKTYTQYSYELKSGFGGTIGLEINQKIYKGLYLNCFGAYRFLNLKEDWDAYNPNYTVSYLQTKEKRDFSGGAFGIGLSYKF